LPADPQIFNILLTDHLTPRTL